MNDFHNHNWEAKLSVIDKFIVTKDLNISEKN